MVYDITNRETFTSLQNWLTDIKTHAESNVGIIVCANKIDLEDQRQVPTEDGQTWAQKNGFRFLETSAKSAINVEDAFMNMVDEIFKKKYENALEASSPSDNKDQQPAISGPAKKSGCCTLM